MKLLLTSVGFANKFIIEAFSGLAEKPFSELRIVAIPTAANMEDGDKTWLIEGFNQLKKLEFGYIDIVDIAAVPRDIWEPRLKDADVLLFGGGNTFHLLNWVNKSGLRELLPDLLKDKIYLGISAGSYIACPAIEMATWKNEDVNKSGLADLTGLNLVPFLILAHYTPDKKEIIKEGIAKTRYPVKILDDNQAILVQDNDYKLVGQGEEIKL
jgi:dipeptidase E